MPSNNFHSGFVAIVGRANVGKSTLLNAMLGQKLSIVSPKPHTTRHKLLGVLNGESYQVSLLDTPGFLRRGRDQMDAAMSRQLASALADADLVMLVVEPRHPGEVEKQLIAQIKTAKAPAVLAINKVDATPKARILPVINAYIELHEFAEVVPVSGLEKDGVDLLQEQLVAHLPERQAIFSDEVLTDRSVRFLVSEIIREKVFHLYEHEVPYDVAVEVEDYEERAGHELDLVRATIYVDKPSQKQLLIGKGGEALKEVGSQARMDIQELVGRRVFLELWVKVNPKWRRKAGFIQRLL